MSNYRNLSNQYIF